jgi:hypothetical protein
LLVVALSLAATGALGTDAQGHPGEPKTRAATEGLFDDKPIALQAQRRAEPPLTATPRADCRPGGIPEGPMQGRVAKEDVEAGRLANGYRCNLSVLSQTGSTGGFRVHRYVDNAGRECAYYDTALLFPTNALSLSRETDRRRGARHDRSGKPVRTATLVTPGDADAARVAEHQRAARRAGAVLGNPRATRAASTSTTSARTAAPRCPCRASPPRRSATRAASPRRQTFYPTSISTDQTTAVDLSNPRLPRRIWEGRFNTHGMTTSDDGTRGYFAAGDGLIIADLTEVQQRKPDPQVPEISRLRWSNMTIPQVAIPVTIKGRRYLVEVDEYSATPEGEFTAHGARVGAARIIDIEDERNPSVVSNIRLAVHQPENRAAIAGDFGAQNPTQGYAAHYCNVPSRVEPGIMAAR